MRPFLKKILIGCQFIKDRGSQHLECSPAWPRFLFKKLTENKKGIGKQKSLGARYILKCSRWLYVTQQYHR